MRFELHRTAGYSPGRGGRGRADQGVREGFMFHISRAIYRELAEEIDEGNSDKGCWVNHHHVLAACESAVERMVTDRHYFARPARTLFNDIRIYFPMSSQERVYRVVRRYIEAADGWLAQMPRQGYD